MTNPLKPLIQVLFKLLLSTFLIIATMNSFSAKVLLRSTTTLALVYDEIASVFLCDIEEAILSDLPEIHQVTIEVDENETHSKLKTYQNCDGILDVYEVQDFVLSLIPVDPFYTQGDQWNLSTINLPEAWELTTGSADVIVAVIDTGVNQTNSMIDFGSDGILLGASIINGITNMDTTPGQYSYDGGSHGTAVASLISANMNNMGITGVAPGVKILPIKVFRDEAYENEQVSAFGSDIAAAILWATNQGADIINLSLGGSADYATQAAVEYAYDHGVILVAASGNDSDYSKGIFFDVSYPAAYPQVIAVGSLKPNGEASNFSNIEGNGITLSAYGESIYLPWLRLNDFYYLSGTSFSSPTVAGVLALMKSLYPELSPTQAKAILLSGVIDYNPNNEFLGWDKWTGYGMVNAYQALIQAQDFDTFGDTNSSYESAQFIYGHYPYGSVLRPALDLDFYKFTLYESDTVTITLSTENSHDLMFEVYDASYQNLVTVDNASSGELETVILDDLSPGSYYVRVSDFEGRAFLEDYLIQVDYASSTLPIISASTSQGSMTSGQKVVLPVQVSIVESLYHVVTLTKDKVPMDVPSDLLFTELGTYVISVDDVINDPVSFGFTIELAAGVSDGEAYNTDRVIVFTGTATLNGTAIVSGKTVSLEGEYTLIIDQAGSLTTINFSIDKTAPEITIEPYDTNPTYQDIAIKASVNEGLLNAESKVFTENGSFTFSATDRAGNTSTKTVTITNIHKVSSISLNKNMIYLYTIGASETLIPTITPSEAVEKSVSYVSSDPLIVEVDENGKLSAKSIGIVTITVSTKDGNHSDQVVVEVVLSRHLTFELVGLGGTLSTRQGETFLSSDREVTSGTEILFTVELASRYRLYQWLLNGEIISSTALYQTMMVGPTDINLSVELGLIGDLNLTDIISTTDLVLLRRYLAGLDPIENKGIFNADLNQDGKVSTTDLVQLRRYLAGLE
jgi:hypothetical protein